MLFLYLYFPHYNLFDIFGSTVHLLSKVCLTGSIAQAQSLLLDHSSSNLSYTDSSRRVCSQIDTACSTDRRTCQDDVKGSESEERYRLHDRKTVFRSSSRLALRRKIWQMLSWYGKKCQPMMDALYRNLEKKKSHALPYIFGLRANYWIRRAEGEKQKGNIFSLLIF